MNMNMMLIGVLHIFQLDTFLTCTESSSKIVTADSKLFFYIGLPRKHYVNLIQRWTSRTQTNFEARWRHK